MPNLRDKCSHKKAAVEQRIAELREGKGTSGTQGYEAKGCYTCGGMDESKSCYYKIGRESWRG